MTSGMQNLNDLKLIQIIRRRDKKYDGRFYFGVRTTKIYCRPVCPARPHVKNIIIFRSHSEAEKAGYRPCLRCHPDIAPGSRFFEGTGRTVSRALKLIGEAEGTISIQQLSATLGMTDRHLRRLFDEQLGASPIEIINTKRLHLAKQLLFESKKSITEISYAAGFQSLRRFNEAFKKLYHLPPRQVRKHQSLENPKILRLKLAIIQPYNFALILTYLKRHEAYGIEKVTESSYRRYIVVNGKMGWVEVKLSKNKKFLEVDFLNIQLNQVRHILNRLASLFDVDHNPWNSEIPKKFQHIRVPGSYDSFEVAVSIILSQLISTDQARLRLKLLVQKYGRRVGEVSGDELYEFPAAEVLMNSDIESIGVTKIKAQAISELARHVHQGRFCLHASADVDSVKKQLLAITGIGLWTAEMIAMRCLRDPDAFPKNDLFVAKALRNNTVQEKVWQTHRAYLTHAIWSQL